MALPKYETLEPTFITSLPMIPKGAIIEQTLPPGPHLLPLNEEAEAEMTKWLDEEFDELDRDGRSTGRKIKMRRVNYERAHAPAVEMDATVRILEGPPPEEAPGWEQSLAAMHQPTSTPFTPPPPVKSRTEQLREAKARAEATGVNIVSSPKKSNVEAMADQKSASFSAAASGSKITSTKE